jgi:hypothetical protein
MAFDIGQILGLASTFIPQLRVPGAIASAFLRRKPGQQTGGDLLGPWVATAIGGGSALAADDLSGPPSGMAAIGDFVPQGFNIGNFASLMGGGAAPQLPSQGLVGPGGGATGQGAAEKAGMSPGAGTKPMNPILKSFLDEFIKSKFQKRQPYQANITPMGRQGPSRQFLPTLGSTGY